jgi:hypothetical protein
VVYLLLAWIGLCIHQAAKVFLRDGVVVHMHRLQTRLVSIHKLTYRACCSGL